MVFLRVVFGLICVAILLPSFLFAVSNGPHSLNMNVWALLCLTGLTATVFVAARAGIGWMILVVIGSALLSFSSCSQNFHWRG